MVNLVIVVIATLVVCVVGGGLGYLLWLKTRPKKETWNAKVYQLSDGVRQPRIKNGKIVGDIKLQDLRPYSKDILEKVEKEKGITVFRLQKLNKVTPAVESDTVEYWGAGQRDVSILLHKGGCTLLRKGYDKESGEVIFDPLPHDKINLIKNEIAIRKDRLEKEKDILQAITPWVVTGICMLGLVAIAYVQINGFLEVSENLETASKTMAEAVKSMSFGGQVATPVEVTTPGPVNQSNIPTIR